MALRDLVDTKSFALLLFIFLIRLHESQAGKLAADSVKSTQDGHNRHILGLK